MIDFNFSFYGLAKERKNACFSVIGCVKILDVVI
jgi:hypothetical protein